MKATLLAFLIICCFSCCWYAETTTLALDGPISPTVDGLYVQVCVMNISDGFAHNWHVTLRLYRDTGKTKLIWEDWRPHWCCPNAVGSSIQPDGQACTAAFRIPAGYTFNSIKSYDGVIEWNNENGSIGSAEF